MSNYYMAVNHSKLEYIHGLAIAANDPPTYAIGLKGGSMFHGQVSHLLTFLLSDTEKGRQRWVGDNIAVISDSARGASYHAYAFIDKKESGYRDVTREAIKAWNAADMNPKLRFKDWDAMERAERERQSFIEDAIL